MKSINNTLDDFLLSWKFIVLMLVLQFIIFPIATKGFQWEACGDIVVFTLAHAVIQGMYPYAWAFQISAIVLLTLVVVRGERVSRVFSFYAGCCYLLYAVIQNVAVTEKYGISVVTINLLMMFLVAAIWLRSACRRSTRFTFSNLNWKTAWIIPVALFCLWWPMDMMQGPAVPDFHPVYLFTGGSAMAFCPMTPVFLSLLVLSKKDVDRSLLRVTAMIGFIIGCYNMGNFATAAGLYLGIYHLPLLGISLYALFIGKRHV